MGLGSGSVKQNWVALTGSELKRMSLKKCIFFAAHFSKYNKYIWDQDPDPLKRKQNWVALTGSGSIKKMYFFAAHFSKYNKYNWDQDPDPLKRKQLSSIEGFFCNWKKRKYIQKKCGCMNLEKHINIIMEHAASNLSYDKCVRMFLDRRIIKLGSGSRVLNKNMS